jgi:hypothetical protein
MESVLLTNVLNCALEMPYRNNVKKKQKQLQRRLSAHLFSVSFCIYNTSVICTAQYKVQATGNTLHILRQVRVSQL